MKNIVEAVVGPKDIQFTLKQYWNSFYQQQKNNISDNHHLVSELMKIFAFARVVNTKNPK